MTLRRPSLCRPLRRTRRHLVLAPLAAAALLLGPADGRAGDDPVTAAELLEHVRFLASDDLGGRGTGEPGGRAAADYVADQFRRAGLEPLGDGGGWLQEFPARVATSLGTKNLMSVPRDGGRRDLALGVDFIPFSFSATGECSAPVVFAGYGITAPEYGWDDYTHLDVRGKIVLALRYEPGRDDTASAFLGRRDTHHADLRTKARNAELHGAVGLLVVNGPLSEKGVDELVTWSKGGGTSQAVGIPTAHVTRGIVEEIWGAGLADRPADLAELQARLDAPGARGGAGIDITDRPITLRTDLMTETRTTWNVVGYLAPTSAAAVDSRPARTPHLVIGAHYDHLGLGGHSSLNPDTVAVHNGADDNASGTAALIELAESFAGDPAPRARGLVFVAFGAEELGLFGASWYIDHAPIPVEDAVAMLNMDMVGRLKDGKLQVGGVGTSPAFRGIVEGAYRGTGVTPVFSEGGSGPSDHSAFNGKKRPVLFFFTGVHEDYHRPSDDWEKINAEGMEEVVRGVRKIAAALIGDATEHPYLAVAADSAAAVRGGGSGYGAYLGTVPDMAAADVVGVKLSDVRPGGPAALAGLAGGDVIVAFDGRPIRNLYDMTDELRSRRPGDAVDITVKRGEETVTLKATLGKR